MRDVTWPNKHIQRSSTAGNVCSHSGPRRAEALTNWYTARVSFDSGVMCGVLGSTFTQSGESSKPMISTVPAGMSAPSRMPST